MSTTLLARATAMLRRARRLRSRRGIAALEFGIIAPVFVTLLAGAVDLGNYVEISLALNAQVAAGANFALVNAASANSTAGATLASNVASIVANGRATGWANDVVVVNDGPTVTTTGGTATASGTAAPADSIYCPSGSPPSWTWNTPVGANYNCPGGGTSGKFVTIVATRAYTPIMLGYIFAPSGTITAATIVQVQ
ncbi:MAG: pilus assembly protein [Rhodospirillales bacterium]|nr:pilus assembly protein [Rhodospirillales bacterium]MDE2200034.1 pilus assembly protein [Rhodospirillales bacterium]MDE2574715.1 pilus assembly protein [Rhodospirillales bacterium]